MRFTILALFIFCGFFYFSEGQSYASGFIRKVNNRPGAGVKTYPVLNIAAKNCYPGLNQCLRNNPYNRRYCYDLCVQHVSASYYPTYYPAYFVCKNNVKECRS
ncbi:uncharacterized protein LOC122503274 [Leptopilina heterotoma]|uniref:uncharacterized protein LOC122503274 n=1 Tax=Leptopilina heterotoma TaxID=63436 RepID=UPI001CA829C0|nr:uncharacterized protein LOC122503274 [Leptopilina heterotoma]